MNKTPNYQLNQWEAEDRVLRTDFNADNAKIDAAIAAAAGKAAEAHVYVGSFVGDGVDGRTIQLPWAPKFVILFGYMSDDPYIGFLAGGHFHHVEKVVYLFQEDYLSPLLSGSKIIIQNSIWFNRRDKRVQYILFR